MDGVGARRPRRCQCWCSFQCGSGKAGRSADPWAQGDQGETTRRGIGPRELFLRRARLPGERSWKGTERRTTGRAACGRYCRCLSAAASLTGRAPSFAPGAAPFYLGGANPPDPRQRRAFARPDHSPTLLRGHAHRGARRGHLPSPAATAAPAGARAGAQWMAGATRHRPVAH